MLTDWDALEEGPRVRAIRGDLTHAICSEVCGQRILDDVLGDFPEADVGLEWSPAALVRHLAGTLTCGGCGEKITEEMMIA